MVISLWFFIFFIECLFSWHREVRRVVWSKWIHSEDYTFIHHIIVQKVSGDKFFQQLKHWLGSLFPDALKNRDRFCTSPNTNPNLPLSPNCWPWLTFVLTLSVMVRMTYFCRPSIPWQLLSCPNPTGAVFLSPNTNPIPCPCPFCKHSLIQHSQASWR